MASAPALSRSSRAPLLALVLFAFAHVVPLLARGRVLVVNDFGSSAMPAFATLQGHVPIVGAPSWTDAVFGGAPEEVLAAMPRYPGNLLAYVLPPHLSLPLFIALHLSIAAIGAWWFARRIAGASPVTALVGGMGYAFGGALWLRGQHPDYLAVAAWMPFAFVSVREIAATSAMRTRRVHGGLLSIFAGLMLLTGGGAPILYLAALTSLVMMADGIAARVEDGIPRRRAILDAAPWLVVSAVGALCIGAPGLVPFVHAIREGARGDLSLIHSGGFSLSPPGLVRALVPDLLLGGKAWAWPQYVESWIYVGVLTLPLAAIGARDRRGRFLLLVTVAAIVAGLGLWGPLHYLFFYLLPGYSHVRAPGRWGIVAALFAAALAARGLESVLREEPGAKSPIPLRRLAAIAAAAAVVALAVAATARAGSRAAVAREGLVYFAVQALLAAAWLTVSARKAGETGTRSSAARAEIVAAVAIVLLGADLAGTAMRLPVSGSTAALEPPRMFALAASIGAQTGGRIAHDDLAGPRPLNNGTRWGYRNVRGYSQIVPERFSRLLDLGQPAHGARFTAGIPRLDAGLFRLLGVAAWVGAAREAPPPGFISAARDGDLAAFRSVAPPFVASVVSALEVMKEGDAERAAALAIDPFRRAVVVQDVGLPAPSPEDAPAGTARVERHSTDEVEVRVDASRDALLVLADTWHPRWRATLDGAPVPILRADALWRGVRVPRGTHDVLFRCAPAATGWTWLSFLMGALLAGLLVSDTIRPS